MQQSSAARSNITITPQEYRNHIALQKGGERMTIAETRRLLTAAKHECGHVVVALVFGGTFTDVEIGKGATAERNLSHLVYGVGIRGVVRGVGADLTDPHFVITLMAGVAGERVNRKKPGTFSGADILGSAGGDYTDASPICTPSHIRNFARRATTADGYLNECLASAFEVIQLHKGVHSALVGALMEHQKLTYGECVEIFQGVPCDSR